MNTKNFDTLYKSGSRNAREWKVKVIPDNEKVDILVSYGDYKGKKTLKWTKDIQGKNIGKSNETTPFEQAVSQAESLIKNKKRKGYKTFLELIKDTAYENKDIKRGDHEKILNELLTGNNTNLEGNIIPMKAQQYYRASNKPFTDPSGKVWKDRKYYYMLNPYVAKKPKSVIIKFPCIIQPKINGVRCIAKLVNGKAKLFSKNGLEYNVPHIIDALTQNKHLFDKGNVVLDGELYSHGMPLQDIGSAVDKTNIYTPFLEYVIFDLAIENMSNIERLKKLKDMFKDVNKAEPLTRIRSIIIGSDKQAQKYTDKFIEQGYEGSILRAKTAYYQFDKRPMTMVKLKRLMDEEFEIIGVIPQEKDPSLGLYVCRTSDGKEFKTTPTGTEEFKKEVLENKEKYIGKDLTCWFYEYTNKGIPFHIVNNVIRNYE